MTELEALDPHDPDAPLHGIRVLEIAGELTGYAGRLLAELGAEVVLADLSSATPRQHTNSIRVSSSCTARSRACRWEQTPQNWPV